MAPSVFGIISEKISINNVKVAEIIRSDACPNNLVASAPTPAAPIVCAIVFNANIADNGLSMFCLKSRKDFAHL